MGKTGIVFVEPGAKVNSEYYCQHVLGGGLLSDIRARCQRYSWTLQQDGAPSHTAHTNCAVENDGSLVIGEFVDERGVQFWNCRRESNCHKAKR